MLPNQRQIVKDTFVCGLLIFAISTALVFTKSIPLILIFTNLTPGFIYGLVLSAKNPSLTTGKRSLFITLSGGLFILVVWLATDHHLDIHSQFTFVLASSLGACVLFVLYNLLIRKNSTLWKGLLLSALAGAISAIFPARAYIEGLFPNDIGSPYDMIIVMTIFLFWQSLFGLIVAFNTPAGR